MKDASICLYLIMAITCSTGTLVRCDDYRLPKTLVPTLYSFILTMDPRSSGFSGSVSITFHGASKDVNTTDIYLHYDPDFIQIFDVSLNKSLCSVDPTLFAHIAHITCTHPIIGEEQHALDIRYSALYSTNGDYGMVKSRYKYDGEEQIQIESYFKPVYARRAFPCMDEPDFEASFVFQITHPSDYRVITNSRYIWIADIVGQNTSITSFNRIPNISTYLVSIFMSKFSTGITLENDEGIDTKIFARPEVANFTLVQNYYSKIVDTLSDYTGFPYQNFSDTESYLVAVPDYTDAMGGFALFAYRETDFLDEGANTTRRTLQNIITTMAYKLSQEWYGGEVCISWWSDVWANEAVASYLKYIVPDKIDASLELRRQFVTEVTQKALLHDGMPFAQPLSSNEADVNSDWDVGNKLDPISYLKGASILHMINYMLGGADKFKSALQNHFRNRRDSNTDGANIINDLFSFEGKYYEYMESWVFSSGFPLVTAKIINETDQVAETALYQKRFVYPTANTKDDDTQWYIPISSTTQWSKNFTVIIQTMYDPHEGERHLFGSNQWILFNLQGGCFFRMNYDETLWGRIINTLKTEPEDINVIHRAQLLDDIFNVARIGDVSYILAFELAEFLGNENEYYPWYSAFNAFSYLLGKMESEEFEETLQNYLLNLMENVIEVPSTESGAADTHVEVLKKVMVLDWACYLGHTDCIAYTTKKFKEYQKQPTRIDNNYRGVILCNGIRHSEDIVEDFWILSYINEASTSVHEQNDILKAYGCAEDKDMIKTYLLKIITEDPILKKQDVMVVFRSVFSSSVGLEAAMEFLESNIIDIYDFYHDVNLLSQMVYAVAEKLFTDDHINWLNNVLSVEFLDDYEDLRSKALVYVSVNNFWVKHFRDGIRDVFPLVSTKGVPTTSSSELPDTTSTTEEPITTETTTSSSSSTEVISTTTESGNINGFKAKSSVVLFALCVQTWFYKCNAF